ncbi:MAG: pyridoxal-5-phosphate-dependent protein subunit beta, partial [Kiritimatiellae bacterium]|nr:pyridoxal-5-phosphate-dependent protein subunit beta [Kiritimatiellia bacterium]
MKLVSKINKKVLARSIQRAKERGIILPTFAQQKDPSKVPAAIQRKLKKIGLWDVNPLNLFRITWKNEPKKSGGGFNQGNFIEFPKE